MSVLEKRLKRLEDLLLGQASNSITVSEMQEATEYQDGMRLIVYDPNITDPNKSKLVQFPHVSQLQDLSEHVKNSELNYKKAFPSIQALNTQLTNPDTNVIEASTGDYAIIKEDGKKPYFVLWNQIDENTGEWIKSSNTLVQPYKKGEELPDTELPVVRTFDGHVIRFYGDLPTTTLRDNPITDAGTEWKVVSFSQNDLTDDLLNQILLNTASRHNEPTAPAPILHEIIPPSLPPNTTATLTFKVSLWGSDQVDLLMTDHIITPNSLELVSDNEFKVEVTTPAIEQEYDVSIRGRVFSKAFIVTIGEVYKINNFINSTGVVATSDNKVEVVTYGQTGTVEWDYDIPNNASWVLKFKSEKSPLGDPINHWRFPQVALHKKSDATQIAYFSYYTEQYPQNSRPHPYNYTVMDGHNDAVYWKDGVTVYLPWNDVKDLQLEVRFNHVTNTLSYYCNGDLVRQLSQSLDELIRLKVSVKHLSTKDLLLIIIP